MKIKISKLLSDKYTPDAMMEFEPIDCSIDECLANYLRYNQENQTPVTYCIQLEFPDTGILYATYLVASEHANNDALKKTIKREVLSELSEFLRIKDIQ